jgi:hypothetical protein
VQEKNPKSTITNVMVGAKKSPVKTGLSEGEGIRTYCAL